MAIRIDVKDYCAECCDFEPDVTQPTKTIIHKVDPARFVDEDVVVRQTDTIVRCKHRNRCEAIKRYLEKQKENKE